tara:strand:+ start:960 stop:2294 length:1335 start_codon:yes stop_codon:yes gene_type:complete
MSELPKGWKVKLLGDLIELNKKFKDVPEDTLCGFVPMGLIPVSITDKLRYEEKYWSDCRKGYTHFKDGDVLLAKITPCFENGKSALVEGLPNGIGSGSTEFFVMRPLDIEARYLHAFVKTKDFMDKCRVQMTGSVGHKRVPKDYLLNYPVPVAPLEEQKRIADKLDSVLAKVEAAQARLDKIPAILKRFRQSVLAAATSGELTKEWRKAHRERSNSLSNFFIEEYDGSRLTELPANWGYVEFKNAAIIKSNLVDPKLSPKSIHLAPNHIEPNTGRVLEQVTVEEDGVKSSKHRFFEGQLIYSKIRPYLNKVCLVSFSGLCSADMYPIEPKIDEKYLLYVMLSEQFVFFASQQQGRVVLPKINQKALNKIPIPVPPEREQTEISRKVEELLSKAEIVERQYWAAKRSISHLNQSILSKAFKGELLSNTVNSEIEAIENSIEALNA